MKTTVKILGCWLVLTLVMGSEGLSAQRGASITVGGQVRPRVESRTPVDGSWDSFTSMRVRAQIAARLEGNARVFIQLQDVRLFGEEANTLGDFRADNFDLHQGYVELTSLPGIGGNLRVGRQELLLGEQRLVGPVGWSQQGRSFDGVRYTPPSIGDFAVDFFAMRTREASSPVHESDAGVLGAYGKLDVGGGSLDLYGIFDTDSETDGTDEITVGANWRATAGPLSFRLEGSLQSGERNGSDVSAFMVGARAGGRIADAATLTFWYDYLSGDDDPDDDEVGVFNTLYATNHVFYGLADLFLNIPAHTGGLGLQDAAVKLSLAPLQRTTFNIDVHSLRATEDGGLSTRDFANELDFTLAHRLSDAVTVQAGYSFAQVKDGLKELNRFSENVQWMYVMLNSVF